MSGSQQRSPYNSNPSSNLPYHRSSFSPTEQHRPHQIPFGPGLHASPHHPPPTTGHTTALPPLASTHGTRSGYYDPVDRSGDMNSNNWAYQNNRYDRRPSTQSQPVSNIDDMRARARGVKLLVPLLTLIDKRTTLQLRRRFRDRYSPRRSTVTCSSHRSAELEAKLSLTITITRHRTDGHKWRSVGFEEGIYGIKRTPFRLHWDSTRAEFAYQCRLPIYIPQGKLLTYCIESYPCTARRRNVYICPSYQR